MTRVLPLVVVVLLACVACVRCQARFVKDGRVDAHEFPPQYYKSGQEGHLRPFGAPSLCHVD